MSSQLRPDIPETTTLKFTVEISAIKSLVADSSPNHLADALLGELCDSVNLENSVVWLWSIDGVDPQFTDPSR